MAKDIQSSRSKRAQQSHAAIMSDRQSESRFRFFFLLCLGQAFLLLVVSFSFQFMVMHNMDLEHPPSLPLMNTAAAVNTNSMQHPSSSQQKQQDIKPTIAYTVTLTGCGKNDKRYSTADAMNLIHQGAAVLSHSIHLAHLNSKYNYQMYALVHPTAKECSVHLPELGYTVLVRNTPFDKSDIRGQYLREHIDKASCCGEKEFIKLYAYTLINHPVAVVLDLDSLVLQPLDVLFDAIIEGEDLQQSTIDRLPIHQNGKKIPKKIDAFYTKDYNMINPGSHDVAGVQGGFLMVRPSEAIFDEYIDLVLEGNYIEGRGWGGKYGYFFGGAQVQGICAYYYSGLHPEEGVELNRCRVNSMVDSPYFEGGSACRDGREGCEDCRETDLSSIMSSHFTICGKPWLCNGNTGPLCRKLHGEWFRIRREFEKSRTDGLGYVPELEGSFQPETFYGYCKGGGRYDPIKVE
ncbi:hypothetical protein ACHAXN_011906 [Cyclotella atomus]